MKVKYNIVFLSSITICAAFILYGAIFTKQFETFTTALTQHIAVQFSWYYLILVVIFLALCLYLLFSKYREIKLGKADEQPEFSLVSWFSMLFCAGMGMGLVFWTTSEPISDAFILSPEHKEGSKGAIASALQYSFFHWGIHAWAVYCIVALVFAYFSFYKGYPGLVSAMLRPLLGEGRIQRYVGNVSDILAVIATVTGVAATLGFGTAQINDGLNFLFDVPSNLFVQTFIIIMATVIFTISAWSGISKGIKHLSNINMILAVIILIAVFIVGPTLYILNMFTNTLGNYMADFLKMSLTLPLDSQDKRFSWMKNWTLFYWAWWIAWSPFVGIFIARISRGRTIKEFILGVLFVPALICFVFFAVFGGASLYLQSNHIAKISSFNTETATFAVLEHFPFGFTLSILTIIVVAIFFITSADSATYVLGMLTSRGSLNPTGFMKVSWGVILALFAIIMFYTGGMQSIQNLMIITALPFSLIIILMIISFFKVLRTEHSAQRSTTIETHHSEQKLDITQEVETE